MRRTGRAVIPGAIMLLTLAGTVFAQTAAQPTSKQTSGQTPAQPPVQPAPPPAPSAIPLIEINGQSEALQHQLAELPRRLPGKARLELQQATLKQDYETLLARVSDTEELLASNPTLIDVRGEERFWRWYDEEIRSRPPIVEAVRETNRVVALLEEQEAKWRATLDQIVPLAGVSAVSDTVRQSLSEIQRLKADALEQRGFALTLQHQATRVDLMARDELDRVRNAIDEFRVHLLSRDAPPLWEKAKTATDQAHPSAIDLTMDRSIGNGKEFFQQERSDIFTFLTAYLVAIWLILSLRKRLQAAVETHPSASSALSLMQVPVALAFFAALPFYMPLVRRAPTGVMPLVMVSFVVPLVFMAMQIWRNQNRIFLWATSAFFLTNGLLDAFVLSPELKRFLSILYGLVSGAGFAWAARSLSSASDSRENKRKRALVYALYYISAALLLSVAASVFGYLTLAQVIRQTTLLCVFVGSLVFIAAYSAILIASAVMHVTRVGRLSIMRTYGATIEAWLHRIIIAYGLWFWISSTLELLSLRDDTIAFFRRVMEIELLPSADFTLGELLILLVIVIVGYLVAKGVRITLRDDVLSRFRLNRGIPELISSGAFYIVLTIVCVTAAVEAGVRLDKFTVLTGALGVGLGFGLQNVVNNFVSGLILQFERPINVGDFLDVGNVVGTVSRIGVRSSTLLTPQGAEVIIPNATFISGQVTNWTLHSTCRRVDIPVRVAYGTDPKRVNELLLSIVAQSPGVLKNPPAVANFKGFGESALEFELMFWSENSVHFKYRNEIAIAIDAAFREAGIEIPIAQRAIHIHNVDVTSPAASPKSRAFGQVGAGDLNER